MRWQRGRRSRNVEDRRGRRSVRGGGPVIGGGLGLLVILGVLLLGGDPTQLLFLLDGGAAAPPSAAQPDSAANDELADFVSVVLAGTEDTWSALFQGSGSSYPPPTLVLYRDAVESACGYNTAATGPFYCPGDRQVYLDLGFLDELRQLGAPGDFAFAYVIAHEVGHHVQNVTGVEQRVRQAQRQASRAEANQLSVMMELQADCYAGIWGAYAREMLEPGDLDEGLRAAASIGDDRLQQRAGQRVAPESFTHGTSAQRVEWFRTGLERASVAACDTFAGTR